MKIVIAQYGEPSDYEKPLLRSIETNCPSADVVFLRPEPPSKKEQRFLPKMNAWCQAIQEAEEDTVLLDLDTLVLDDLSTAFEKVKDIGICRRIEKGKLLYNTGVVFVKPSELTRRFLIVWRDKTEYYSSSSARYRQAIVKAWGTDQAAFFDAIKEMPEVDVKHLSHSVWNLCTEYERFSRQTKVIHFKGKHGVPEEFIPLWKSYTGEE